jgi:hypothetical protein
LQFLSTAILKKVDPLFVVAAQPQPQTTGSAFSDIALIHDFEPANPYAPTHSEGRKIRAGKGRQNADSPAILAVCT